MVSSDFTFLLHDSSKKARGQWRSLKRDEMRISRGPNLNGLSGHEVQKGSYELLEIPKTLHAHIFVGHMLSSTVSEPA
jgi:hypothetical protein